MEQQKVRKRKVKVVKQKSRKKLWTILGSLLGLVLIGLGTLYYYFELKEYDIADTQVDEIVREPYTIELPDGTVIEFDEEGNVIGDEERLFGGIESTESSTPASGDVSTSDGEQDESSDGSTNDSSGTGTTGSSSGSTGGGTSGNGGSGTSSGSGSGSGSSSDGSGNTGGPSGDSSGGGQTDGSTGGGQGSNITVAAIKDKYNPTFAALEGQADAKLNALIGRAKAEYVQKRENGEDISYGYFYNKYSAAASELEANTDAVFYGLLGAVKRDLERNGYAAGYADSFVSEYEQKKAARRNNILSQVR